MPEASMDFGEVLAWGLIAALVVYGAGASRLSQGGAVALAALAALVTKAMLLPLV